MAWKHLVKNKHNYIQSYQYGKNYREKRCNNKSKFVCSCFLKLWKICRQKSENKNQCSIIIKIIYENCVTKAQYQNTKNLTLILIFPRYRTNLFICCVIYLYIWWHCAKCTANRQIPWNDLLFRPAWMVQTNTIKRRGRHVY